MTIKKLFDRAWAAAENRSWVRGLLGKPDGAGGYTVEVTGRPNHVYVRVSTAGSESVTIAKNLGKVANRANLPVKMRLEIGGTYTIYEVDSTYYSAATTADSTNEFGVVKHTHRIGTNLEYEIEPERFEPGRVYSYLEFEVWINAFRYHYNGAWQYWEGGLIDITAYLPTTSTKWGWVLVGVDPETNTAIAVAGAEVATQAELLLSDLDAIAFSDYIPCGAIQCAEADTDSTDFTRYYDAHAWFTAHLDFNDLNDPSNVTTGTNAAGNSPWAARDDHLHGITDAAVTFVKMQDIATDRLLGRDTAGTGVVEQLTVGGGVEFTGSGGVQRSALTGDVTASAGNNATTIANDAVTNAKLANMAQATIKGRAAGAGTGDPTDLTGAQVAAIVGSGAGGVLYVDATDAGNVGTGEDNLASYTLPAATLTTGATLWYEISGTFAANGNAKILRVKFGAASWYVRSTTLQGSFIGRGRVIATGAATQVTHAELHVGTTPDQYLSTGAETLSGSIVVDVTGEATADNDIVLHTLVVGWTPAP